MNENRENPKNRLARPGRLIVIAALVVIAWYGLIIMPTNYVVLQPGTAEAVKPMVQVKEGYSEEKGTLMLTTVRMTYANAISYVLALMDSNADILNKNQLFRSGESQSDYTKRQEFVMTNSQSNAIEAAYKKAGVPFHTEYEGIVVLQTLQGFPAEQALQAGDRILEVNGTAVHRTEALLDLLKTYHVGDRVSVTYLRGDKEKTARIALGDLSKSGQGNSSATNGGKQPAPHPGLGIAPADLVHVQADDPGKQVTVNAGDIGGPSAGLMFSLEIYNRLVPEDITKGYRIAGTGEIDPQGNVGVIGGIRHKIVAADREGAEIFFSPKDLVFDNSKYPPILNYSDAVDQARKIHSGMKVVPVKTMDDALNYLRNLPPKAP
ncbi:SepM family pheromone-processing serine protease [Ferviditalea candida]|uniref:endopeptidase La n=1 Tax=Ferviditalea candida TaxID=3108399 RepID=A0ABU5ZFC4_9BACL|nr:SepM family pheromone-processing serine protease [Paenibacillaceae bacterium T2]